jgi:hypothetical protein
VPLFGPLAALALGLVCFHGVLLGGEQFAYRDAAGFYYPLYLRVQQEWSAGRWPLWEPGLNGGMPLLGMPMAAVFYPGKVLYATCSPAWATRIYTITHVAIAWAGTFALARAWRLSATAAALAALAYAFGAPVLFQYCNVIYLVGAAWVPWGFLALDWMLGQGRRSGVIALALVLSLQVLGGDPESAYLTMLCGGGYALVLAWGTRPALSSNWRRGWLWFVGLAAWAGLTLVAAYVLPRAGFMSWRPRRAVVQGVVWGLAGLAAFWQWRKRTGPARLAPMLAALAAAAALAIALTAVQLLPAAEFALQTARTGDDRPGQIYGFCVEPYRIIEMLWPDAFGRFSPDNRSWIQAIAPAGERLLWAPSLYLGGLTMVLAAGGLAAACACPSRDGSRWPAWLALVAAVAILASFGRFGGSLWLARWIPGVEDFLGPHDPLRRRERVDVFLQDGAGSVYGLLALVLPGLSLFRYPAKLFPLAALSLSVLAGLGWDRVALGDVRAVRRWCLAGLAATAAALILILALRGPIAAEIGRRVPTDLELGPVSPRAAVAATVRGLVQSGLVLVLGLVLVRLAPRNPRGAGGLALFGMALDLGVAGAPLVWTVPQAELDAVPRALSLLADAERQRPGRVGTVDPYRVHRMEMVGSRIVQTCAPADRISTAAAWRRDTLEPLSGIPWNVQYTLFQGILENEDYVRFFVGGFTAATSNVYYLSVRGMCLWNARYLILPVSSNGWVSARERLGVERIYPDDTIAGDAIETERWIAHEDWQLVRNLAAFPRAWVVHDVRVRAVGNAPGDPGRLGLMSDLIGAVDALGNPARTSADLRAVAFVETARPEDLAGRVSRTLPGPGESVTITRYEPQRVDLRAELDRPGLVVLADVYDPGWALTIDGVAAPVYRTNRMMRGALLGAGRHKLVYIYDPASFRIGRAVSLAAVIGTLALIPWARSSRVTRPRTGSAP